MVSVFSIGIFNGSGLPAFELLCRANLAFPFLSSSPSWNDPSHHVSLIDMILWSCWLLRRCEAAVSTETRPADEPADADVPTQRAISPASVDRTYLGQQSTGMARPGAQCAARIHCSRDYPSILIECARGLGNDVVERVIMPLAIFSECFLSGAAAEMTPV
jgi:hypothetical protein